MTEAVKEKAPKAPKAPKAEKAPTPPKAPKVEQNGVSRPKEGSETGKVWTIADNLTATAGKTASRADVVAAATKDGINEATAATQYGRWRKFNGITGTVAGDKPAKEPKAPKTPKAPKAEAAPAAPAAPVDEAADADEAGVDDVVDTEDAAGEAEYED
jgi:hypothetical protein